MEAIRASTTQGKVLHFFHFLFLLGAWIGCCVGFGAPLISFSRDSDNSSGYLYYNRAVITIADSTVSESPSEAGFSDCDGSGKGFVAMLVFAFIFLTFLLGIFMVRITGQLWRIQSFRLNDVNRCILLELIFSFVAAFFYFLAIIIWTAECFHSIKSIDSVSSTAIGYVYIVICQVFILLVAFILLVVRYDSSSLIGDVSAKAAYGGAYVSASAGDEARIGVGHYDDRLYGDGEPLGAAGAAVGPGNSTSSYQYGGAGYPPAVSSYQAAALDDNSGL